MKVIGSMGILAVLLLVLGVLPAFAKPFSDDFERADSADLGNDWDTVTDGTITVEIVDKEVLISGTQGKDWARSGLSRAVEDETRIYFDFLANDKFNVHVRIDDSGTGAYIDIYSPPGGSFSYASSPDGGWPGWTPIAGSNMLNGQYNTLGIEKDGKDFDLYLNDKKVGTITNKNLENITSVLFACDSAAGTKGSLHIDNVVIGEEGAAGTQAVDSSGKLAVSWGGLKAR